MTERPRPTGVTVDLEKPSFYAEQDTATHRFKRRLSYRNILRRIAPILSRNPSARVLEIGTGSGYLLAALEEVAPEATLVGIEYDPRLVELAKSKVRRALVVEGNAETFELNGTFDLVVSSQVIEHLYQPEQMIRRAWEHLAPNGWLIITTPNLNCVAKKLLGNNWHGFRDDHVSLKSSEEWGQLITAVGFRPLYQGSTFFTGIPLMNRLPLGLINWALLLCLGSLPWKHGESYVGLFEKYSPTDS